MSLPYFIPPRGITSGLAVVRNNSKVGTMRLSVSLAWLEFRQPGSVPHLPDQHSTGMQYASFQTLITFLLPNHVRSRNAGGLALCSNSVCW
jgi:hypothetical protein